MRLEIRDETGAIAGLVEKCESGEISPQEAFYGMRFAFVDLIGVGADLHDLLEYTTYIRNKLPESHQCAADAIIEALESMISAGG